MKLNYKNTLLVGLAFLSISTFWQLYDNVLPLILANTFNLNETWSGIVMAADNVLGLILLPFFGALSDKTDTDIGKRMPYILFGSGCAIVLMNMLPYLDNSYYKIQSSVKVVSFIFVLTLLLVSMNVYRTPAVALMPDVTPKPFRSRANAIINLMGAIGAIIYLVISSVLYPSSKTANLHHVDYQILFTVVSSIMFIAVGLLFLFVKEPKLVEENKKIEQEHPEWNLSVVDEQGNEHLPKEVKRSLVFLLISIFLWFMGYNAVSTWFTTYISRFMNGGLGDASRCLLFSTGGAIVSYIPVGLIATKIGRKKTIMGGITVLTTIFIIAYFLTTNYDHIVPMMYVCFVLAGTSCSAINVNSLPMVVEICKSDEIGKYVGYYYTASMAAQILTPTLAGTLMRLVSYKALFIYSAVFVFLSFITMCFVKHGDHKH